MARSRGRPPKPRGATKDVPLPVRVEASEKAAFMEAAELEGLTLSGWVRNRLRAAARKELGEAGHEVPFLSRQSGE